MTSARPGTSPTPPDFNNIVQFKIYLYGQGDPVGEPFQGTVYIDELQVRDTPLIEFGPHTHAVPDR